MSTMSLAAAAASPHVSVAPVCALVRATYVVSGVADAQFLSRVLEPVAKLGLVPERMQARRSGAADAEMTVDLRLTGVSARHAELVEFALRAIVGVGHVNASIDRPN